MAHRLDALVHPLCDPIERLERVLPRGWAVVARHRVHPFLPDTENLADALLDVLGADPVEGDPEVLGEEEIRFGHG